MKNQNRITTLKVLFICAIAQVPLFAAAKQLAKDQVAPSFTQVAMDGKMVHFPEDYKGKIVILNFWATWCRFCLAEQPSIVSTYKRFGGPHFDVLALTMDNPKQETKIAAVVQARGMVWTQVYHNMTSFAGNNYTAGAGKLYFPGGGIAIPQTYLVDGDTGKVLAVLNSENMMSATETAMRQKFGDAAVPPDTEPVTKGSTGKASLVLASSQKKKFYIPEKLYGSASIVVDGKPKTVTSVLTSTHAYESAEIVIGIEGNESVYFEIPLLNASYILSSLVSAPGSSLTMGYLEYDSPDSINSGSWDSDQTQYMLGQNVVQTGTGKTTVTITAPGVKDNLVDTLISATFEGTLRHVGKDGSVKTVKVSGSFKNALFTIPPKIWPTLPLSKEITIR